MTPCRLRKLVHRVVQLAWGRKIDPPPSLVVHPFELFQGREVGFQVEMPANLNARGRNVLVTTHNWIPKLFFKSQHVGIPGGFSLL